MHLLLIILLCVYLGKAINYLQGSLVIFKPRQVKDIKHLKKLPILQAMEVGLVWFEKKVSPLVSGILCQAPDSNSGTANEATFLT